MTNKEFFILSEQEVKKLNGSKNEESYEAWRAGYNYARKYINKCLNTYCMDECISKFEEFSEGHLEEFNFE